VIQLGVFGHPEGLRLICVIGFIGTFMVPASLLYR
jgi:hypothetical protein